MTFRDRIHAGRQLAERFRDLDDRQDVIVLGLPRGGVPVAAEVARSINAPLDVLLVRKIGTPGQPELAMGAIATGDELVLNDALIAHLEIPEAAIQHVIDRERLVLQERERLYRGDRPFPNVHGQIVLLIDDGLATGSTMRVAIQAVKRMNPAMIAVGVPVGAVETVTAIGGEVDRVECVATPANFMAVGRWYEDFLPVPDVEVIRILE